MTATSVRQRINDRLVAPGASRGELLVAYTTALAGSGLATVLALAVVLVTGAVPAALAWVAPVLFVKLFLGHLLPGEAA